MSLLLKLLRAPRTLAHLFGDRLLWPLLFRIAGVRHGDGLSLVGAPIVTLKPGGRI